MTVAAIAPNTRRSLPCRSLAWLLTCLCLASCATDLSKPGATCTASVQCTTHLCYANRCLVPNADLDGDGLDNATERLLGSDPF